MAMSILQLNLPISVVGCFERTKKDNTRRGSTLETPFRACSLLSRRDLEPKSVPLAISSANKKLPDNFRIARRSPGISVDTKTLNFLVIPVAAITVTNRIGDVRSRDRIASRAPQRRRREARKDRLRDRCSCRARS